MRNILAVFTAGIIVVFVIALVPASLESREALFEKGEEGKVLGVSQEMADEYILRLLKDAPALPKSGLAKNEPSMTAEPLPKDDFNDLKLNGIYSAIMDAETEKILFENNSEKEVPIASISKMATALTFLDYNPGWERKIRLEAGDIVGGGRIYVNPGETARVIDLFALSLVASANSATKALVRSAGLAERDFVEKMNMKMKEMGLENTGFYDPIGLSSRNISTAREVALIIKAAMSKQAISDLAALKSYSFFTKEGREVTVYNTDKLLSRYPSENIHISGGKTGYTKLAGYCFAGKFKNDGGNEVISVVLGDSDFNSRFKNTEKLVSWAYGNYSWQ